MSNGVTAFPLQWPAGRPRAIEKTIEALRGIERWGSGEMLEAAFIVR